MTSAPAHILQLLGSAPGYSSILVLSSAQSQALPAAGQQLSLSHRCLNKIPPKLETEVLNPSTTQGGASARLLIPPS